MNVLLIALDTLRADHLGCYGYAPATSPALDRFAAGAVRFANCLAPAIPTQPGYTTVFTGQHSITHGIVTHGGTRELSPSAPWLPEMLLDAGYTTCAVDDLATCHEKRWFLRGYEFYIDPSVRRRHTQGVECAEINSRAIPWLRAHAGEKFFMFVHYWDPHTPYLPPERYRGLFYQGDPCDPARRGLLQEFYGRNLHATKWRETWIRQLAPPGREIADIHYLVAMYDSEIRYLDDGIAELLAALEEAGVADETLVVFFADHGEEMYEHDTFFDHHGLYQGNLHVPFLVRWPGKGLRGRVVPHLVQHVDLAPTILEIAGLEIPPGMEGTSLVPYLDGSRDAPVCDTLVTQECTYQKKWAILRGGHKLIVSREPGRDIHGKPPRELYDLQTDPGETTNLAESAPERVRELEARLQDWIAGKIAEHGLPGDPLLEQEITIGKNFHRWLDEHGYW